MAKGDGRRKGLTGANRLHNFVECKTRDLARQRRPAAWNAHAVIAGTVTELAECEPRLGLRDWRRTQVPGGDKGRGENGEGEKSAEHAGV
jgi:hypothetical protein